MKSDNRFKVYVSNYSGHDYKPATKYGQIIPLTVGNINPLQVDRLLFEILNILQDSTPDDYLVLSGHHVIVAIAVSILITLHGKVNLLIWNKNTNDYNVRTIKQSVIEELLNTDFIKVGGTE